MLSKCCMCLNGSCIYFWLVFIFLTKTSEVRDVLWHKAEDVMWYLERKGQEVSGCQERTKDWKEIRTGSREREIMVRGDKLVRKRESGGREQEKKNRLPARHYYPTATSWFLCAAALFPDVYSGVSLILPAPPVHSAQVSFAEGTHLGNLFCTSRPSNPKVGLH